MNAPSPANLPLPVAKRAALLLSAASAIGGAVGPITIGLGGLVGLALLPHEQMGLSTLPVSAFVVGSTLASIPAALGMRRFGRRAGFVGGVLAGAFGALLAAIAIVLRSFWLFTLATTFMGAANAFAQQYRFAAADAAPPEFKAKAIAWVLAGGVVTGVLGPQVAIHAQGLVPGAPFAGPFIVLAGLFLVTAMMLSRLVVPAPPPISLAQGDGRPLSAIALQPKFIVGLLSAIASFALMSLVMTATPLAMVEHHHSTADAQVAIQWHVIAMFAPSFVTGGLIARFGKTAVTVAGLLMIAGAATIALMGTSSAHFSMALILLGIGWNFGFIAATAMVAELYRPEEAFKVQALNEFLLFGVVAIASLSSGGLLTNGGWTVINLLVYPIVAVCVATILLQRLLERRVAAT